MRLWSLHPKYLDVKGLTACWREGLLAQQVLLEKTKGYKNHPQLTRFKLTSDPIGFIGSYLNNIYEEAKIRGYNYNSNKIVSHNDDYITVTNRQIEYEFTHLMNKLFVRDLDKFKQFEHIKSIAQNPVFKIIDGEIEQWEKL